MLTKKNMGKIIEKTILSFPAYFNQMDLYAKLKREYQINDRAMINDILDDLAIAGKVNYVEISDGVWAFEVT